MASNKNNCEFRNLSVGVCVCETECATFKVRKRTDNLATPPFTHSPTTHFPSATAQTMANEANAQRAVKSARRGFFLRSFHRCCCSAFFSPVVQLYVCVSVWICLRVVYNLFRNSRKI